MESHVEGTTNPREIAVDAKGPVCVRDMAVSFVAGGTTDCTSAALVATGQSGGGYLTIINQHATATIYVGKTGVSSTTGMPLLAGDRDTTYWSDVSAVYAVGASNVGWGLRR